MSSLIHASDHEVLALAGKVVHQLGQVLMELTAVLVLSYLLFLAGALVLASVRHRRGARTSQATSESSRRTRRLASLGRPVS